MVDCQIHTSGVSNSEILKMFETVPRELFVPKAYQDVSYLSEDILMGEGRFILEPAVHARMLEALDLKKDQVVLDVGLSNGYSAAILSGLVTTVVCVEPKKKDLDRIVTILNDMGACNVAYFTGKPKDGRAEEAPYDAILVHGAVGALPEDLITQLAPGGKMVVIVKEKSATMGQVMLVQKHEDAALGYSSYCLFEAACCSYIPGFEPEEHFRF